MILSRVKYYDDNFELREGSIATDGEYISGFRDMGGKMHDMHGLTAFPGFIDIHTHGGAGADACDKSEQSLKCLSQYYASHGVTSFCPTTMTLPFDELCAIFESIESFKTKEPAAYIQGINMEGPYISHEKRGAQNEAYIREPDLCEFKTLNDISKISLVDLAPELNNSLSFANSVKDITVCSVAHTNATYERTVEAFQNGFTHVTHFYNAMTPFSHREPGVVGATLDNSDKTTVELICDGLHLHEAAIRLAFNHFGDDRCVTISDSLSSAGAPDGRYFLGGQEVFVKKGQARLADGTLAGSTSNLLDEFKNLLRFGIPIKSALKSCTINPARVIGADSVCGSLKVGKRADIIFVDNSFELKAVMIKGKFIELSR